MKITLKKRKTKNGTQESLYLEYYKGYIKTDDGKIKHNREFESLNLSVHIKPKTQIQKQENKDNLELAEKIRIKRMNEYNSRNHNFYNKDQLNYNFLDYFSNLTEERKKSKGNYGNWDSTLKKLREYCNVNTRLADVDEEFVKGFKKYLEEKVRTKSNLPLSKNSQSSYYGKFTAAIKQAIKEKKIFNDPTDSVTGIQAETPIREYLTFEEVNKLSKTDCRYPVLKRAFLFSCLTGLRWSDINKLIWSEVKDSNGELKLIFEQKKTSDIEYLYISEQARELLGDRKQPNDRVFTGLKYGVTYNSALLRWCHNAGVYKHITFHCARHTNAVLLLELGADIYTVSKRLGHSEIRTTEIYAKIVDKKNKEAAELIPNLSIQL